MLWNKNLRESEWEKCDARFVRTEKDRGKWVTKNNFPENWIVEHNSLKFKLRLTPFKHTGVFPEQSWQWDYIEENLTPNSNFLSLFGYTGIASLAALKKGAKVTQVDASRPAITWFKENQEVSGLGDKQARIIIDDCLKFTAREIKRGNKYDAVIMDPPAYGHGPKGEKWSFNKDFPILLDNISQILSSNPLFVLVNAYAISSSSVVLANMFNDKFDKLGGKIEHGELTLKEISGGRILSTGIWAKWSSK